MALPQQFMDELRRRVSLSSVIGKRVKLISRGNRMIGLCPFHQEKTPSFHVRDEDGRLDNLGKVRTAGFQNLAHVRQRLSRFCFDATFDDFHGFRDERDAAARVEEAARLGKREMKRVSKKERRKKPINTRARKKESA